jgi:hypothetical protein
MGIVLVSTNNIATGMVAVASTLSIHQKYVFLPPVSKNIFLFSHPTSKRQGQARSHHLFCLVTFLLLMASSFPPGPVPPLVGSMPEAAAPRVRASPATSPTWPGRRARGSARRRERRRRSGDGRAATAAAQSARWPQQSAAELLVRVDRWNG